MQYGEPWKSFVASVDTEEWKKISEKAKKSVKENINPACVGRCGFVGLEPHIESRWNQLVSSYPHLDAIEHPSSIRNTVSKARLNPVTKLYELKENLISNGDLTGLLELLDDGSYSTKKNKNEALETTSGEILGSPGMGLAAGSSSEILSIKKCKLLHLDDKGALKVVAIGRVHPIDDRVVHGCPIIDGFVKVQIDRVVECCGSTRLLPESCIYGEIELLKDAKGSFIQWPVKLIKILNKDSPQTIEPCHHFISTPYRPQVVLRQLLLTNNKRFQMKETSIKYTLMHYKMMRLLINCFLRIQRPSMFLFVTELVHAYQHTKPVIANQPTKTVHANKSTEPIRDCQHTKPIVVASKSSTEKIKVSKEKIKVLELLEMARSRPQNIYRLA
ncbi:hypothetical protein Hdeb2414_s0001g00022581 [Helianthus debilis subsp. tardiflorus]